MNLTTVSLFLMAAFYIFAGVAHFRTPKFYYKITPPALKKWAPEINVITGVAEIALGIGLLIPAISSYAAWGIILLLLAVFPANIYHLQQKGAGMKIAMWLLWIRLPLQGLLILWAFFHI